MLITHEVAHEHEPHKFVAEASSLGLPAGKFPSCLRTTLGNKHPFMLVAERVVDGDLQAILYQQEYGCITLEIFND